MRKILSVFILLFCTTSLFAGQYLKEATADTVNLKFVDATDGITAETGLDVTTFDCNLIKHGSKTAVALTVTAEGGSTNDAGHIADGIYYLELNTVNTNTLGKLDLFCQCSGAAPFEGHYEVVAADSYAFVVEGDIADLGDFFGYAAASVTDQNSIFYLVKNADQPISSVATEVFSYAVPEPTGPLAATPTFGDLQGFLKQWTHDKLTVASTGGGGFTKTFFNDAGTATAQQTGTDNGTVYTINKAETP